MTAILRRELRAYFTSPIGYVFLAVFYVFSGAFFYSTNLIGDSSDISGVFNGLITILLFLIPILTMRLFSEERRHKTDQILLTSPVTITGLVLGKFAAAAAVYLLALSETLLFGAVVHLFTPPNWAMIWGNFAATLLLGLALIAVGMFISSLTENQVVAAVGGFAVALFLLLIDIAGMFASDPLLLKIVSSISFYSRYQSFYYGIFRLSDALYFLTVGVVFLFLTVRSIDKRRWA